MPSEGIVPTSPFGPGFLCGRNSKQPSNEKKQHKLYTQEQTILKELNSLPIRYSHILNICHGVCGENSALRRKITNMKFRFCTQVSHHSLHFHYPTLFVFSCPGSSCIGIPTLVVSQSLPLWTLGTKSDF